MRQSTPCGIPSPLINPADSSRGTRRTPKLFSQPFQRFPPLVIARPEGPRHSPGLKARHVTAWAEANPDERVATRTRSHQTLKICKTATTPRPPQLRRSDIFVAARSKNSPALSGAPYSEKQNKTEQGRGTTHKKSPSKSCPCAPSIPSLRRYGGRAAGARLEGSRAAPRPLSSPMPFASLWSLPSNFPLPKPLTVRAEAPATEWRPTIAHGKTVGTPPKTKNTFSSNARRALASVSAFSIANPNHSHTLSKSCLSPPVPKKLFHR